MKLIVNIKLKPLDLQADALLDTMREVNKACNWMSAQAFEQKTFKQFALHKIVYQAARELFNLSAQNTIRAISKVADSYLLQNKKQTAFKPLGSIAYDDRIIRFKKNDLVSIWTTKGRIDIPFQMGDYQRKLFKYRKGEVDLMTRKGVFYLNAVCDVPEEPEFEPKDILGVDFGVVNICTTSDGENFSGSDVEQVRLKNFNQRQLLQHKASKQTQSGKRPRSIHKLIKRLSGREHNFRKHQNHVISKKLVKNAKTLNSGIALEELKHIRKGTKKRFKRSQRAKISGWSFAELRSFVEYKSKLPGVAVYFVNPKHTSQTCHKCGHCEKSNRVSQSEFVCKNCNLHINSDNNAAINIRGIALVTVRQKSESIDFQKSV